jgi:hypothetical protein
VLRFEVGKADMARRPFRLPTEGPALLEPHSAGRRGPNATGSFTRAQIEQIARTVRRTPEVMVKVTGGGTKVGAVAAHIAYIGRKGALEIETDDGQRVTGHNEQKAILEDWHLELSAGQYRRPGSGQVAARATKLVHNIVLSMPSPAPPSKVLAAARVFARERFGAQHRYAMVLHTDQAHPHVHLVVKAESEDGRRLHIDKPMLREWREDFARMMREQGVAANATPGVLRGRGKARKVDGRHRSRGNGSLSTMRKQVVEIAQEIIRTGSVTDPTRERLLATRKALLGHWAHVADTLDLQGEIELAGDVRVFALHLPSVMTNKERIGAQLLRHAKENVVRAGKGPPPPHELTR